MLCAIFGSLPWRSRSQHGSEAKSCSAHNFVIWISFLQLFHRNDHHIKIMFHYLAHYLALCVLYCIILRSVTYIDCRQRRLDILVWSLAFKVFPRNHHHIGTTCHNLAHCLLCSFSGVNYHASSYMYLF